MSSPSPGSEAAAIPPWAATRSPAAATASLVPSSRISTAGVAALWALLIAMTIARFVYRAGAPLWLDEVWTGMIAGERSLSGFVRQCYLDVNAPLGYAIAWLWEPIGGLSNEGLRLPSRVFTSLAPLVALTPSRSFPRGARAIWACLIACWLPGFIFASEARCYGLLLCLGAANALAFAELLRFPGLRLAFAWAAISSLLILTHYFAAPLVACEGLVYLAVCRAQAPRTWPALAAFIPAGAEMAAHAAVLRHFSKAAPAHRAAPRLQDLPDALDFLVGGSGAIWMIVLCLVACLFIAGRRAKAAASGAPPIDRADWRLWAVPATAVGSVILCEAVYQLCLATSLARPVLVVRYFTGAAPGVLLGLALFLHWAGRVWRPIPALVIGLIAVIAIAMVGMGGPKAQPISFQRAAEALMNTGVHRVEFFYDDRGAGGRDHDAFSRIGGFFFHRAGLPIESDAVFLAPGQDPNPLLLDRANANKAAILWVYNPKVASTAALRFPPRITTLDPRWRCRDYGAAGTHALACVKDGAN